jgi:drug/metabolite transporter (DMT)-like permease
MVTTPLIVLVFSTLLLREKVTFAKVLGLILGLTGTILLIAYGKKSEAGTNEGWGNFLVFVNAVSYSFYLILVKKLMDKYNAFSFVKWIYLFGLLWVLPFGYSDVVSVNWQLIPFAIWLKIGFVVVFSTFVTYMLNLVTMRRLSPTLVAVFIYLQPVFASIYALSLGKDTLNFVKIVAALLIFIGVYLVTVYKKNAT